MLHRRAEFLADAGAAFVFLPEEVRRGALQAADFAHVRGLEQTAVDHHIRGVGGGADVLQRVAVDHDEVGALADFERAEFAREADVVGAVDGGGAQRFPVAHAALGQHPHFPKRAHALQLAVAADLDADAGVAQSLGLLRHFDVVVVPVRADLAADRARAQGFGREEALELGVVENVFARVPPVFAVDAAVVDDQGGRVAHVGLAPEFDHVAIQRRHRDVVLHAGHAVEDHRQIVVQRGAAFLDHQHAEFARGLVDHLVLFAPRLVVALHAEGAGGFQALQVRARVVDGVDDDLEVAVGAVEDAAGREHARADQAAGFLQFGLREHRLGAGRGVVQGRHAEGEVGVVGPVLLRHDAAVEMRAMAVHVDDARIDGLAAGVDAARAGRDGDFALLAERDDLVAAHDQHAVLDHFLRVAGIAHRHQTRAGEGEGVGRRVAGDIQPDVRDGIGAAAEGARMELVADQPVQGTRVGRPVDVTADAELGDRYGLAVVGQIDRAAGRRQRRYIDVEQFGEGDLAAVGADADEVGILELEHVARLLAEHADRLQRFLQAATGQEEHALALRIELRVGAAVGDLARIAAVGVHDEDAAFVAPQAAGQRAAAGARIDDAATVVGITRPVVEAGLAAQRAHLAAGEIELADRGEIGIRPGRVQQLAAVGAEAGLVFEVRGLRRQARGRAVRQRLLPQLTERVEDEGVAVGAGRRIADHLRFETVAIQAAGETQRCGDGLRDLGAERDLRRRAAGHVHAPEFALAPDHHRLRIRRPAEVRVRAEDRPDFLLVVREAVPDRAHFAGFQIEHVQHGLVAHAFDEGQRLAVRRRLRTDGAASGIDHRAGFAGLAVEALDRVDHAMHVLVVFEGAAAADVFRVIDVTAIGTHGRFAEVHLVVLAFGQLQAAGGAAVDRIHP